MFENINSSHILKQDSPTLYSVHKYVLSLSQASEHSIMFTLYVARHFVTYSFMKTRKLARVYTLEALQLDLTHRYVFSCFY